MAVPIAKLKGKIASEFFTLFHTFFPQDFSPSKQRALAQGEQKRRKDKKKKRANRILHVSCCTFVLLLIMHDDCQ